MSATYVYLVSAYTSHESCNVIACFSLERDAKAFADRCRKYDEKKPHVPYLNEPDENWTRWEKANGRWYDRHPAKLHSEPDAYIVEGIRLRPAVMKKVPK